MYRAFLFVAVGLGVSASAHAAIKPAYADRLKEAAVVVREIQSTIPQEYWTKAHCVTVIPDLKKAAFIVGGEFGKGVISCRTDGGWSAPVFMQLAKGSWGFQAGAEEVDLVLLVMNESGVQKLLNNKVSLGADASVAAGPIGRAGGVATDAQLTAEIISYSRAKGLFAGIDLSGGVLRPDEDANRDVYGAGSSPRTLLASRPISAPPEAAPFLSALGTAPPTTAAPRPTAADAPARSSEPEARATTRTTTDDDLRTRIVEMQQTIDRMLADTTPAPVGTSGTVTAQGSAVSVDRTRLVQLRQQLDALLAAMNRR